MQYGGMTCFLNKENWFGGNSEIEPLPYLVFNNQLHLDFRPKCKEQNFKVIRR